MGGIQVYLWELWRRLEPASFTILTASSHPEAETFDEAQGRSGYDIRRLENRVLLPTPAVVSEARRVAAETGSDLVVIDPVFPLGLIGPRLGLRYAIVLHGAEIVVPGRLPFTRSAIRNVLSKAEVAICGGEYAAEAVRKVCQKACPPIEVIDPGVDTSRFRPLDAEEKAEVRKRFDLPLTGELVVGLSRLVPRKGMDVLIEASAALAGSFPDLTLAIGGDGRDRARLERLAVACGAPVRMLGRIPEDSLADLYGASDVFAMLCRDRWMGLEQEGFGIVFLEAAACGVPQLAGRSGGSADAVADGETGYVVDRPSDPGEVASALRRLLSDPDQRLSMGLAARDRAVKSYDYDDLSLRLGEILRQVGG